MSNKQLAKNSIYNIGSFIINLFISFFFTPYLIKTVGKEAYSFFPLANSLIGYTSIITTIVGGMAGRFVTVKIYQRDIEGAKLYYNSVLVANWILSILFTILSCFVVALLNHIINIPIDLIEEVKILFAFSCATFIIGLSTNFLGLGCFIKNRLDISSLRTIITNLFRVGIILLCFSIFEPTVVYMSSSAFISAILLAIFNIKLKQKLLPEIPIQPLRYFKMKFLKEVMSSSIWSSINQLGTILVTQLDLLITNIFIGVNATADYSIAKTLPTLILTFISTLSGVFIPSFNILYAKGEFQQLHNEINKSMKIMSFFTSIPIGFFMVFGKQFLNLWVPGQNIAIIFYLTLLSLIPLVFNGAVSPLYHVYATVNKVKQPSIVFLLFGLFRTFLVFTLLKYTPLGLWSIPIGSLISSIIKTLTYTPIYAAHCLNKPIFIFHKYILKSIFPLIITITIGLIYYFILVPNTWCELIICALSIHILSIAILFFTYLSRSEKRELIQSFHRMN